MKRAQVRMAETIGVLFIFFVLLLFGIIFYYQYQKVAIKERQEEILATRAMDTTLKTLFAPELFCSKGDAEPEANCFDLHKLEHANETFFLHTTDYYYDVFSFSKITVVQLYPDLDNWTLYDKPPNEWTRTEPTFFVIALRDELERTEPAYHFGYVKVEVYS
jgi:hypothetical protein